MEAHRVAVDRQQVTTDLVSFYRRAYGVDIAIELGVHRELDVILVYFQYANLLIAAGSQATGRSRRSSRGLEAAGDYTEATVVTTVDRAQFHYVGTTVTRGGGVAESVTQQRGDSFRIFVVSSSQVVREVRIQVRAQYRYGGRSHAYRRQLVLDQQV